MVVLAIKTCYYSFGDYMDSIGQRIKALRETAHLTQEQLGEKVGVTGVTIMRYEKGLRHPKLEMLGDISTVLGAPLDTLLGPEYLKEGEFERILSSVSAERSAFSDTLDRIEAALEKLNSDGRNKAVERVEELTEIRKYTEQFRELTPEELSALSPPEAPDGPPEAK